MMHTVSLCVPLSYFLEEQKWQNRLIIPAIIEKLWISGQPIAWQVNNLTQIKGTRLGIRNSETRS